MENHRNQPASLPGDLSYTGLSAREAAARLAAGQGNNPPKPPGKSVLRILADNFFTLFNLLNLLLAAALAVVGEYRNMLFLGVVASNTLIGTAQALRARRTIARLELMSAPLCHVARDGAAVDIPAEQVVLGDLAAVRAGEPFCADGEMVGGQGAVDESLLTGESEPVVKRAGDTLLSGSYVTEGTVYMRVTKVAGDSYAAQLTAKAKAIREPHSELMLSMRTIVRGVGAALAPLGAILFCRQYFLLKSPLDASVTSTVAAVLGMIPEGLVLLTSVALAVGVVRLGRKKALVQELYGIESLARVDILCLDKTGTLTQGTMAVTEIVPLAEDMPPETLEARLSDFVAALDDQNATFLALRGRFSAPAPRPAAHTVPFSSARKWSAACFAGEGSYVVGAAEYILTGDALRQVSARAAAYTGQGFRVLLCCHSEEMMTDQRLPAGLVPLALLVLEDVLRPDAAETLSFFAREGVTLKVISGDAPLTVAAVAKKAGLSGADRAVDATTLDTPEALQSASEAFAVFGRVTPDQKKEIVQALKEKGHTVGMVGDGVNDIPALKAADCAIAMAAGSEAARRVAQVTLLNSNFSSVPDIVMEGRRVINNITRAASLFLVKTTFSFLLSLLLVFLPAHYPFAPIQMTLISALTVGAPSFFLALEPNRARVRGSFLRNVLRNALPGGLTIVTQILLVFAAAWFLPLDLDTQSTMAVFCTGFTGLLVLLLTCLPLNFSRLMLCTLMAGGFFGMALFLGQVFYLVPLPAPAALVTAGLMLLAIPLVLLLRRALREKEETA